MVHIFSILSNCNQFNVLIMLLLLRFVAFFTCNVILILVLPLLYYAHVFIMRPLIVFKIKNYI